MNPVSRNTIVGKLLADAVRIGCKWIEDPVGIAAGVDYRTEVTRPDRICRYNALHESSLTKPEPFIGGKPKCLIFYDGSTRGSTKFIADVLGRSGAILNLTRTQTSGVVAVSFENAAVKRVGSTPCHQHHAYWPGILSAGTDCFNAEFLNGVEGRRHAVNAAAKPVHQTDTIQ